MKIFTWIKTHWKISLAAIIAALVPGAYAAHQSNLPLIGKSIVYQTVTPTTQDIEETISLSGTVEANQTATLKFQTAGLLTWVGVKEGDRVKKYQAIASLDKRKLQQSLKKEMNNYLNERWDFEQTQDDYQESKDRSLVTDSIKRILEKAQFDLENSVIDYELKDLAVRLATITSPIEGIVTSIDAPQAGVNITPATATFKIINPQTVYFSAEVDETDIARVKPNSQAVIVLDAYPDEDIASSVQEIAFTPKTGTSGTVYEVKLALPQQNQNLKYKIGLNGDAQIIVKQKQNALTVPTQAIKLKDNKTVIYLLKNNKKEVVEVKTSIETENATEIISGVTANSQIIIDPNNGSK